MITNEKIYNIGLIGKVLKIYCPEMGNYRIFKYLRDNHILILKGNGCIKGHIPCYKYHEYFHVKEFTTIYDGDKNIILNKTYFNEDGLVWFLNRLIKEGYIQAKDLDQIIMEISKECGEEW